MKPKDPRADEQAAADAISAVVQLAAPPEFEPNGRDTAPDWRMRIAGGRVADVEVICGANRAEREFTGALSTRDSAKQIWPDARLSWEWTIVVSEISPKIGDRSIKPLKEAVCDELVAVEKQGHLPGQMCRAARPELIRVARRHGGRTRGAYAVKTPQYLGEGLGRVCVFSAAWERGRGVHDPLLPVIQECISKKVNKRPLGNAPDLKWLAVALEGLPSAQLTDLYGPNSRQPHPKMDTIAFDYFDEVWVIASIAGNYTSLRLSEGGDTQQAYVAPLS